MKKLCLMMMLVCLCTACKKDLLPGYVPLGTLKAVVDGSERKFENDPAAEWTSSPDGYDLCIHGKGTLNLINISINSQTLISAKTYNDVTIYFYRYGIDYVTGYSTTTGTVVINEINENHVEGTFKGILYRYDGVKLVLSEGVFNLSL